MGKTLGLPVYVIEQFPAHEILEWRAFERIESKELEDARLIASGKPPKHYPQPGMAKKQAKSQYTAWINAFDI